VPVEKDYHFETNDGTKTLAELFDGRSQLIVRHFMHGPKTPEGCPGCTFETDNLVGAVVHLAQRDVTFILASRSPPEALNATWQLLDRAPRGRGENFDGWPRKRDEYLPKAG
jgi:predicted dithiol-disulfide oxidoreductase (DUF899 family)